MAEEEGEAVNVGWVSLSRSGRSLTIKVLDQMFFVPLRDLQKVLDQERQRVDVKQWGERGTVSERKLYRAVCADCGNECEVPFKPDPDRLAYCRECWAKRREINYSTSMRGAR